MWFSSAVLSLVLLCKSALAADPAPTSSPELDLELRTHSIYAPYVDQDLQNRWFSFGADAYVNTNKYIRLTRDKASQTGWLWSVLPIGVSHYQIEVEFKISGAGSHLFGDGMAIWLTTKRAEVGPVFGSIDNFEGLGVFIDTFANSRHSYSFPRVMAMLGDGKTHYEVSDDGDATSIGGCSAQVRKLNVPSKIRITYYKSQSLNVELLYKSSDEWTSCFSVPNITLPAAPYLGFTALTGELSDAHDVLSVSTRAVTPEKPKPGRGAVKASTSSFSFGGLLLKLIFIGAVGAMGVAAYRTYYAQRGQWSSKRF
ncbi:hypothetical protein BOTBODRAFT_33062 [Botryobasidium botryosum FD-172 SS1]|uniref:L-type lectin-like domain-containing protein n=1 Tax=Botryobasidium botryosum (strain FD-172 SS1) TaxID=930990 RepID=A0A067MGW5_BOTB1|nr:hypothetical protein BOTBODRAFT_33062 [Botryobasidium botryosum FD-172 SS1]